MRWAILIFVVLMGGPVWGQTPFATFDKASEPILSDPHDLTFGPDGQLYVADKFGNRIVVMDPDTLEVTDVIADGLLPGVHDISFGPDGKAYVAVTGASAIAVLANGPEGYAIESALQPFPRTEGVLAHSNGRTYIMSSGTGELVMMQGRDLLDVVSGMPGAHDVAEAPDGTIWVADNMQLRLVRFSQDLEQLQVIQGVGFGFAGPRYLDFDEAGRLIVADQDAHRILLIDPVDERLVGVLGDGTPGKGPYKFDDPEGVAVRGNAYYFADSDNNRIVKYVVVLN